MSFVYRTTQSKLSQLVRMIYRWLRINGEYAGTVVCNSQMLKTKYFLVVSFTVLDTNNEKINLRLFQQLQNNFEVISLAARLVR